ncbi:uncharacterized protein LOC115821470 [Chanos chanos]|uniref:Uncharacterized protein LOC115821470 n=1 Tax=Chanos chanos TaxID=29144 RepID=A0A6J2W9X8_CHACN|nr:uncharacterized protein LOC115821470 [Chanos chanos]
MTDVVTVVMPVSLSPAAVCQCFTLVSLCTSIADPNWIEVRNTSDPNSNELIYGVAFTLHAAQNLTDTGPLGGVNGWGMWLLYALAAVCYCAVLFSSSSFLLDFLGVGVSHSRLVTSLHVSTTFLCLAILGVWGACLFVIHHNLTQRGRFGASGGAHVFARQSKNELTPYPGESPFIEIFGLFFSLMACGFTLTSPPVTASPRNRQEAGDSETEPLVEGEERQQW